jgi:hypothetical protein
MTGRPLAELIDDEWAAIIADQMEMPPRRLEVPTKRRSSAPTLLSIVSPKEKAQKRLLKAHERRKTRMDVRRRGYWHEYLFSEEEYGHGFEYGWTQYRKLK